MTSNYEINNVNTKTASKQLPTAKETFIIILIIIYVLIASTFGLCVTTTRRADLSVRHTAKEPACGVW